MGDILLAAKDHAGAVQSYGDSLAIAVNLANASPAETELQRDLSIAYDKLAKPLAAGRQFNEALDAYRAALSIREKLAADNPASKIFQAGVGVSYQSIGDTLVEMKDHTAALAAFQKRLEVFQRLSTTFPDEPRFQNDLAASYEQIGETMLALERPEDALTAHHATLAVREKQLSAEPDNAQQVRNVWLANVSVGHDLGLLDRPAEALEYYRKSLALAEKLTASKGLGNTWWMLVMTEQRIGDAGVALGLEDETLTAYRRSIDLLRKQVALEPQNANTRGKLQTNLNKMGFALLAFGKPENALSFYEEALALAPGNSDIYSNRGLAAFHAGRLDAAIDNFATAVRMDPADAYSVLWLHIARSRAGQNDRTELATNAQKLDRNKWPWPVVAYYLAWLDAEKVLAAAASSESAKMRREQTCDANFYLGTVNAKRTAVDAQRLLRAAVETCPKDFVGYAAADLELKRLDGLTAAKQ
jgi:lipoprotein NlpI